MNSKAENSASGLHKGQNHSDNVVRGGGSEGRSSWCRSKPLEAVFSLSPMPAGGRGREHQREDRAGSRGAKRLPQPEQLRPNFPIAEMNTRARAAEQTQSAHSLRPPRSVQEGKDRTGAERYSTNPKFPFEPSLLPSSHVHLVPESPRHQQSITKGPPAYLSKYKLDVSFF